MAQKRHFSCRCAAAYKKLQSQIAQAIGGYKAEIAQAMGEKAQRRFFHDHIKKRRKRYKARDAVRK